MNDINSSSHIVRVDPDYADLVPGFLENRRSEIDIIRNSVANGDFSEIRRLGHGMKGAGAGYGFEVISEIGRNLEDAAITEDVSAIEAELLRLGSYLSEVRVVLDTE